MVDKAKIKLKKSKNVVLYAFRYVIYILRLFIWKMQHDRKWTKYTKYILSPLKKLKRFVSPPVKSSIDYLKNHKRFAWGLGITTVLLVIGIPLYIWWASIPRAPKLRTANNDYLYYAQNQIYTAFLGSKKNNTPTIQYKVEGANVTFTPASGNPNLAEPVREGKKLTFKNIYQNIDYEYQTISKGIKEEIVIREPSIIKQFPFYVDFDGAAPKYYTEDLAGGVFFDESGEYVFHFEKPFAVDANGARTNDVQLILKREKRTNRYVAVVGIDPKWTHAEERVYPIRIDPTVIHDESSEFATGQLNRVFDTGSGSSPNLTTYYQELSADANTAALWHLNEASGNSLDSSGNGFTAIPTGTSVTTGLLGNARSLNGSGEYLSVTDNDKLDPKTITIEAWINPSSLVDGNIVSKTNAAYRFRTLSNGTIQFLDRGATNNLTTVETIKVNTWSHIAVVGDSGGLRIYINGELSASNSTAYGSPNVANDVIIGCFSASNTECFPGLIDEVRISSVARSSEEIKLASKRRPYSVFTSDTIDLGTSVFSLDSLEWTELGVMTGHGETVADNTNLEAQWNFNETSGTTANNDAEGTSCSGTPSNCDGTLNGFDSTASQDADPDSSWTLNNRRWGAGALQFDGTDSYVSLGSSTNLFRNTSAASTSLWFKTDRIVSSGAQNMFSVSVAGGINSRFSVSLNTSNQIFFGGRAGDGETFQSVVTNNPIKKGIWYHFVGTIDYANDEVKVYLNGKEAAATGTISFTATSTSDTSPQSGVFGADEGLGVSTFFKGVMDSTQAYERELSANEVLSLYNAGQIEFQTRTSADSSTWDAWSPTTNEAQVLTFDSATDTNWDRDPEADPSGDVIKFTSTNSNEANSYSYWKTLSGNSQTVATGDTLEYDVFAQVSAAGSFGIDMKFTDTTYARPITDQNGVACHGGTASHAYNRWYHRECTITATHNGKTVDFIDLVNENDTTTPITSYYDNVVLRDSSGNIKQVFYTSGATGFNILDFESNAANTQNAAVQSTHQPNPFETSNDTNIKMEGTGSLKAKVGIPKAVPNSQGLWHLDETSGTGAYITDTSGNGNNGTPTGTTLVGGIAGKARSFNGTTDVIDAGTSSNLDNVAQYSICAWIKPNSAGEGTFGRIYQKGNGTAGPNDRFITHSSTQSFSMAAGYTTTSVSRVAATNDITYGEWNHVCGTWNGGTTATSSILLYINGKETSAYQNNTNASGSRSNSGNAYIGNDDAGSRTFDGVIDEIIVTNHVLTSEEIAEAYRMGRDHTIRRTISTDLSSKNKLAYFIAADRPGTYMETVVGESAFVDYLPDANTVALWHMEESAGSGAYVKDSSGNGNHGTPAGTTFSQGVVGKARHFNGSSEKISTLSSSNSFNTGFHQGTQTTGTFAAWIKLSDYTANRLQPIISSSDGFSTNSGISFEYDSRSGGSSLVWKISKGTSGVFRQICDTGAGALSDNEWHHLAVVVNSTSAAFYRDGQLISNISCAASGTGAGNTTYPLSIAGNGQSGFYFGGIVDEVHISNLTKSAGEIRQLYESVARSHSITVDFGASLDSENLITGSGDTSFTVDATTRGLTNKGSKLFEGDKIVVKENVDGTEYIAQGDVTAITASTGATTIDAWDTGSTFPSSGFTVNATVFKWQREYWDITQPLDGQLDGITQVILRMTNGAEGRTIYIDDLKSHTDYLTDETGSAPTSTVQRYLQYRAILSSADYDVSPSLTSVTLTYSDNVVPGATSLEDAYLHDKLKLQDTTPEIRFSATDTDGDDLSYQVQWDTDSSFPSPSSAVSDTNPGFTDITDGGDTDPFDSGDIISYTFQSALDDGETYYYRVRAKDPAGTNTYGSFSSIRSFTIDTALGDINAWFETDEDQFTTDTLGGNAQVNASGYVEVSATTGTITSTAITAADIDSTQADWGQLLFTDDEINGDIKYKIYYDDTGTPTIIPDVDLAGNSTGFDTSGVDLTGLSTTTYPILYAYAELTDSGGSPQLQDWTISLNVTANIPILDSPSNGALIASTTPGLQLTGTDDDGDNIQYKILMCENAGMTINCQTFDQNDSQTGWSGQDADGNTTYTSGTQGTYTIQSALTKGQTYYWHGFAIDPAGTNLFSAATLTQNFTVNSDPTAPTDLLAEGLTTPTDVTDGEPEFSAICNDPDSGQILDMYQIQVDDNDDFSSIVWDSGSSGTAMSNCTEGERSQDIEFGGGTLALNQTTYYWRIKFWDELGAEGAFSLTSQFTMANGTPTQCTIQESVDDTSLTLNWTDNTPNETQFRIEKNTNGGGFSFLTNAAADSTSYQDSVVSQGNTYQYRVRAEDGGDTEWCTTDTLTINAGTLQFQGLDLQGFDIE